MLQSRYGRPGGHLIGPRLRDQTSADSGHDPQAVTPRGPRAFHRQAVICLAVFLPGHGRGPADWVAFLSTWPIMIIALAAAADPNLFTSDQGRSTMRKILWFVLAIAILAGAGSPQLSGSIFTPCAQVWSCCTWFPRGATFVSRAPTRAVSAAKSGSVPGGGGGGVTAAPMLCIVRYLFRSAAKPYVILASQPTSGDQGPFNVKAHCHLAASGSLRKCK